MNTHDEFGSRGGGASGPAGGASGPAGASSGPAGAGSGPVGGKSPSPAHQPPPGAHFMNVLRWGLFGFLLVLAIISIGSYALSRRPAPVTRNAAAKVVWQCPMHPSYTSDKPGDCPICGMTLERVVLSDEHAATGAAAHTGDVPGLTSVNITPDRVQLIGVRTARVERSATSGQLDLVGFVTPDESRLGACRSGSRAGSASFT